MMWNVRATETMAHCLPMTSDCIPTDTVVRVGFNHSRNHGTINIDGLEFLNDLGRYITQVTSDNRVAPSY